MFQMIVVLGFTYLLAAGLWHLVFGRGLGTFAGEGFDPDGAGDDPMDELVRRRREAAARAAEAARKVRRAADVTEDLARSEEELERARDRLRRAQEARVARVLQHDA